jgi:predicted SAM-dependent methyltransferase
MTSMYSRFLHKYFYMVKNKYKIQKRYKQTGAVVNRILSRSCPLKLELGSGRVRREGWIGIDLCNSADMQWDLLKPLPFPSDSVIEIHSEHCFEHFVFPDQLMPLPKECRRVLVKCGCMSFSVPNLKPLLKAYVDENRDFLKERIYDIPDEKQQHYITNLDYIAWFALREGQHKSFFDMETAVQRLKDAGFRDVHVREFDLQRDYNFRKSSVYVEGRK